MKIFVAHGVDRLCIVGVVGLYFMQVLYLVSVCMRKSS